MCIMVVLVPLHVLKHTHMETHTEQGKQNRVYLRPPPGRKTLMYTTAAKDLLTLESCFEDSKLMGVKFKKKKCL